MRHSEDRILVTHVGSLPRPPSCSSCCWRARRAASTTRSASTICRPTACRRSCDDSSTSASTSFASFAATVEFMPEIVWAKLEALAEGSQRASERLWG
jgi:hypothetical protein